MKKKIKIKKVVNLLNEISKKTGSTTVKNAMTTLKILLSIVSKSKKKEVFYEQVGPKVLFATYIPISKEQSTLGDQYIFRVNEKWTEPRDFDSLLGADIQDAVPVRMFLCTRDIKVGEEVLYRIQGYTLCKGTYKGEEMDQEVRLMTVENEGSIYAYYPEDSKVNPISEHPFKIIGELSPEATFVDDMDEFDSYEEWWYNPTNRCFVRKSVDENQDLYPVECVKKIKVRGNCGHYH